MFEGYSFFLCAKMHFPKWGFCENLVHFVADSVKFFSV